MLVSSSYPRVFCFVLILSLVSPLQITALRQSLVTTCLVCSQQSYIFGIYFIYPISKKYLLSTESIAEFKVLPDGMGLHFLSPGLANLCPFANQALTQWSYVPAISNACPWNTSCTNFLCRGLFLWLVYMRCFFLSHFQVSSVLYLDPLKPHWRLLWINAFVVTLSTPSLCSWLVF